MHVLKVQADAVMSHPLSTPPASLLLFCVPGAAGWGPCHGAHHRRDHPHSRSASSWRCGGGDAPREAAVGCERAGRGQVRSDHHAALAQGEGPGRCAPQVGLVFSFPAGPVKAVPVHDSSSNRWAAPWLRQGCQCGTVLGSEWEARLHGEDMPCQSQSQGYPHKSRRTLLL